MLARAETRSEGRKTPRRPAECVVVIHGNARDQVSRCQISFALVDAASSLFIRLAEAVHRGSERAPANSVSMKSTNARVRALL